MKTRTAWIILAAAALAAFVCFAYPMYVIRPFRSQGASELALALLVRRWGPGLAILCSLASLGLLAFLWQRKRSAWARAGAVAISLLTILFAGLSHVNVYEQMFHPAPGAGFVTADQAKVDSDDMVLAVALNNQARAYPIRTMGYHHIINDRVGGVPIVATY